MIKIVLLGDKNDASLTLPLCRALSRNGGVLYIGQGCICEYTSSSAPEFVVAETDVLEACGADKCILIFKSCPMFLPKTAPSERAFFVCDSALSDGIDTSVITCGASDKSCISLSSLSDGNAVIAVREEITLFSGKILEPCELSVSIDTRLEGYPLLAVCAALILSEKNIGSSVLL